MGVLLSIKAESYPVRAMATSASPEAAAGGLSWGPDSQELCRHTAPTLLHTLPAAEQLGGYL